MANHAYLRVWTRDFSLETMIAEFARFLATAPLSAEHPTFTELIVQAVDATETPVAEWDLRPMKAGPAVDGGERQSEGISRQDARKHPRIVQLGGSNRTGAAGAA